MNEIQDVDTLVLAPVKKRSIFTLSEIEYRRMNDLAGMLSRSSLSYAKNGQNSMSADDLFLIMAKGIEVGLELMAAVESIDLIQGRPTLDPAGMLALCQSSGAMEDLQVIQETNEICEITMIRRGQTPYTRTFTIQDATMMTTTEWVGGQKRTVPLTEKHNWKQQPRVMLKWRLVSAMCRFLFGDIIQGLYTPEEMGANVSVDESGSMIVLPPDQVTSRPEPTNYLLTKAGQDRLAKVLSEVGYTEHLKDSWMPAFLAGIEPDRVLTRLSETTLHESDLHERIREIALTLIKPATPKNPPAANEFIAETTRYIHPGGNSQPYLTFSSGEIVVRAYGRSTNFKSLVGPDYYDANGFETMQPFDPKQSGETTYAIDPLRITYKEGGKGTVRYFIVEAAEPLNAVEPEGIDDLEAFFK